MSSSKNNSEQQEKRSSSANAARTNLPQDRKQGNKIFVTNLLGSESPKNWDNVIRSLFTPHCKVLNVDTKTSYDSSYCYSFVEVQDERKVPQLIAKFNGYILEGRKITVQRQNSGKRSSRNWSLPKGSLSKNDGKCFKCNKNGHIARFCPQQSEQQKSALHKHKNRSSEKSRERKIDKKKDSIIARGRTRGKEQRRKRSRHRHLNDSSDSSQPSSSSNSLDSYRTNSSEKRRKKDKRSKERRDKKRKNRKSSHKKKKHNKRVEPSSSSSSSPSPSPVLTPIKKSGKKEQK